MEMHRFIAEQQIVKRPLRTDEVVHHKDGNHENNDISNLEILTPAEHTKKHLSMMHERRREKMFRERSTAKLRVLDLINASERALGAREVQEQSGLDSMRTVHQSLSRLYRAGQIAKSGRGLYRKI